MRTMILRRVGLRLLRCLISSGVYSWETAGTTDVLCSAGPAQHGCGGCCPHGAALTVPDLRQIPAADCPRMMTGMGMMWAGCIFQGWPDNWSIR
jgi:hypothetical protein